MKGITTTHSMPTRWLLRSMPDPEIYGGIFCEIIRFQQIGLRGV